jgi:RHS repeat-associated protein
MTTVTTDPQGKVSKRITNVLGLLAQSWDHNQYYQSFGYDSFGSLTSVTDSQMHTLFGATYDYGVGAFQRGIADPDLGNRSFTYDALAELTNWTDARGNQFSATYDALSRPKTRTEPDFSTTWNWGVTAANYDIGRLSSVSTGSAYSETYSYDSAGRIADKSIVIPADATYAYDYTYNSAGLLNTVSYPTTVGTRFELQYAYQNGILQKISDFNAPTAAAFWTANATNSRGQVTQETLGNGVITNRTFDPITGWLGGSQTGPGGGATLQNDGYLYDQVGNVTQRQNNNAGLTENFFYDSVYRLQTSTLVANGATTTNLSVNYDLNGNITSRSDVARGSTWTYDPTRIHAVTQAGSAAYSYAYDSDGNAQARNGYTIGWTSFDHPSTISSAGETVSFTYNQDHERFKVAYTGSAGAETTYFVGELLEKVVLAGGAIDYRHYIYAGGAKVAIQSRTSAGAVTTRYLREDHEGSISGILSSDGTSYVKESFTAFGNRRGACTWTGSPTNGNLALINAVTRHGYTWQDALGAIGLNDMHGRIQDATTGRFLSPDPFIHELANTQDFNRYSYVHNNPLSHVDPTGFSVTCAEDGEGDTCSTILVTPDDHPPNDPGYHGGMPNSSGGNSAGGRDGNTKAGGKNSKPQGNQHDYKVTRVTQCSAPDAFGKLKAPGMSAPGAPAARTDPNVQLSGNNGNNRITQDVNNDSMTITNTTLPTHQFFPGSVTFQVNPLAGGGSQITITGTGTSNDPEFNDLVGLAFFGSVADNVVWQCGSSGTIPNP